MKRLLIGLFTACFVLPSVASADLVYFLGKRPSKPVHLISFDTVSKTYSVVVRRLHEDREISVNQYFSPVFDPKTRNVQYIFSVEDPETEISTPFLRTVNIDTKKIEDTEIGYDADSGKGYFPFGPIFSVDR